MLNWTLAYNMGHEILYTKIAAKISCAAASFNFIPANTPAITAVGLDQASPGSSA
jgi:hypothetical protein